MLSVQKTFKMWKLILNIVEFETTVWYYAIEYTSTNLLITYITEQYSKQWAGPEIINQSADNQPMQNQCNSKEDDLISELMHRQRISIIGMMPQFDCPAGGHNHT